MCYARRQRSSWARIKLSKKLYINRRFHRMLSTHQSDSVAQLLVIELFLNSKEFSESLVLCFLSLYTWLLFNFQWALFFCFALPSLVGSLYIISQSLSFVKRFFKTFLSFFRSSLQTAPSRRQPVYYITAASVCQGVFQTFLSFFSDSFQPHHLVDSLYSIP